MPFGGNDWLALTEEATREPEMSICDPHHHFWDFRTARIPYHRYLLHELAADIHSGHDVRSTVFIEARAMYRAAGPAEMRPRSNSSRDWPRRAPAISTAPAGPPPPLSVTPT